MNDQHEQDTWDQDEVEIVDLGAPERGPSRYLFTLGKKWHAASLRGRLVVPLVALALLVALLQPGSSGAIVQTDGAPRIVPTYSPSTIYLIDCGVTINVNSLPAHIYVWEQLLSTPSTEECSFLSHPGNQCPTPQQLLATPSTNQRVDIICRAGTPLPKHFVKNGKDR